VNDCVPPQAEPCTGFYNISKGYRLVVGDKCDIGAPGAINLLPTKIPCSSTSTGGSNAGKLSGGIIALVVLIVIAAVVAILVTTLYLYRKNAFGNLRPHQILGQKRSLQLEEESTALDDDLLEAKEADELDDNAIKETLSSNNGDSTFNPRIPDQPSLI